MPPAPSFSSNRSWPSSLRPLLILGAPRSGTKFLRALLAQSPDCAALPHSLNALWRSGLPPTAPDHRPASDRTARLEATIRDGLLRFFDTESLASSTYLVEKTCANTLRVPFVDAILPNAHFVHIIRDGRDAAVSARDEWQSGPSLDDLYRKLCSLLRSHPTSLLWHVRNWWQGSGGRARWGPRYPGMETDLETCSLLSVCARQWRACVTSCLEALTQIPDARVTTLRYEHLVADPAPLHRLLAALDLTGSTPSVRSFYEKTVHQRSVGRWRHDLPPDKREKLDALLAPTLDRLPSPRPTA